MRVPLEGPPVNMLAMHPQSASVSIAGLDESTSTYTALQVELLMASSNGHSDGLRVSRSK